MSNKNILKLQINNIDLEVVNGVLKRNNKKTFELNDLGASTDSLRSLKITESSAELNNLPKNDDVYANDIKLNIHESDSETSSISSNIFLKPNQAENQPKRKNFSNSHVQFSLAEEKPENALKRTETTKSEQEVRTARKKRLIQEIQYLRREKKTFKNPIDQIHNDLSRDLLSLLGTEKLTIKQTVHKYLKRSKTKKTVENLVLAPIKEESKNKLTNANRYEVYDEDKQLIFLAENVKSNYYSSRFEDRRTPFKAVLINQFTKLVLSANQTGSSLLGEKIVIKTIPDGPNENETIIGYIKRPLSLMKINFEILDHDETLLFKITSPMAASFGSFEEAVFKIYGRDTSSTIGEIRKQWSGFSRELFTDIDCFGVTWPADLDVVWKGVLLMTVLLVDYTFYENNFL